MKRFKNILCVFSSGARNEVALRRAATLAEENQARLTVVEVIDEIPPDTKLMERVLATQDLQAIHVANHRDGLDEAVAPWRDGLEIETKVLVGIPFLEIVREVLREERDLVIRAVERSGLFPLLFGSEEMHLLRKCPCPVWLVKSEEPEAYHRIVAAVDVDDAFPPEELAVRGALNRSILEMAGSLALAEFAELHVVHAWEAVGEVMMRGAFMNKRSAEVDAYVEEVERRHRERSDTLMREMAGWLGEEAFDVIQPQCHLLKGSARGEIPAFASRVNAGLVVMGTVARTGVAGLFMGNTAESVLNALDCSVLAIKPPGFVTPVAVEE